MQRASTEQCVPFANRAASDRNATVRAITQTAQNKVTFDIAGVHNGQLFFRKEVLGG